VQGIFHIATLIMEFLCLASFAFLGVVSAIDPCRNLPCSSCLQVENCVYGIDFDGEGMCVSGDVVYEYPLSEVLHDRERCEKSGKVTGESNSEKLNGKMNLKG
jgi:hypothetical protein